jgi:hypothetical protein
MIVSFEIDGILFHLVDVSASKLGLCATAVL